MKRNIAFLLIVFSLMLTACTRDTTMQPTVSPTVNVTNTPDMPLTEPETSTQPAGTDTSSLQDGEYTAEVSDAYAQSSGQGWKEYLKITVTDHQISNVEFDALKDGKKKSEATAEEYPMTPPPSEWIPKINEALRAAEMPEAMDTVTGATMSSQTARKLYAAVLEAARAGDTQTVVVE